MAVGFTSDWLCLSLCLDGRNLQGSRWSEFRVYLHLQPLPIEAYPTMHPVQVLPTPGQSGPGNNDRLKDNSTSPRTLKDSYQSLFLACRGIVLRLMVKGYHFLYKFGFTILRVLKEKSGNAASVHSKFSLCTNKVLWWQQGHKSPCRFLTVAIILKQEVCWWEPSAAHQQGRWAANAAAGWGLSPGETS